LVLTVRLFGYSNLQRLTTLGSVPKQITNKQLEWLKHVELNPDRFFRFDLYTLMNDVRKYMAQYLGVNSKDLVFVDNASGGMNAIFRSLQPFMKGCHFFYLTFNYSKVF
jgi:isopenicillin-N epimerase